MLDKLTGKAGSVVAVNGNSWTISPWTLGSLGALRNHIFQKALQTTFSDTVPQAMQDRDRATLRRMYAVGADFDPYRLIYDGCLDDEDNMVVFLHQLLLPNHSALTIDAVRILLPQAKEAFYAAVLNENPRLLAAKTVEALGASPASDGLPQSQPTGSESAKT